MLNSVIGDFINAALSAHMDEINKNAVDSKLLSNQLYISEISLYKFALLQYQLPLIIKTGIIKGIDIRIPFTGVSKEPSKITINDVAILCTLCTGNPRTIITANDMYQLRERQLEAHDLFKLKYKNILKILPFDKLKNLSKKMMNSITIEITHFHLRIELKSGHALGLYSDKIIFKSVKTEKDLEKHQNLYLPGLCVYLDMNSKPVPLQPRMAFIEKMRQLNAKNHTFIVSPFDFHATIKNEPNLTLLESILDNININITQEQLPVFFEISSGVSKFMKLFEFIDIPSEYKADPVRMWSFVHESAKRKIKSPYQTFINAIYKIIDRQRYLKLWKKNKKRDKEIIDIEHRLDYKTVIMFRSIAETSGKKAIDKIINWVEMDPILLISGKMNSFNLHGFAENVFFLFKDKKFGSKVVFNNPEFKFLNLETETKITAILSSFCVDYLREKKTFSIFKSLYNEDKHIQVDTFLKTKNNHVISTEINVLSQIPDFCFDLQHSLEFLSNLDLNFLAMWQQTTKPAELTFKIELEKTTLMWILNKTQMINFCLNSVEIQSLKENLVDFFIQNFSVTSNVPILQDLTISGTIENDNVDIIVNNLSLNFGHDEVKLFKPLLKYTKKLDNSIPKKVPKMTIKISSINVESDYIPGQKIELTDLSIALIDSISSSLVFKSFSIGQFISLKDFSISLDKEKTLILILSNCSLKISDIPEFQLPEIDPSATQKANDFKVNLLVSELKLNLFEIDLNLTNFEVKNTDKFEFKFDSIYSSFIEFSKNSSISGCFTPATNFIELSLNFDSITIDLDPLLDSLTIPKNKKLNKPPEILPLKFKIKAPMFPITIKQKSRIISCGTEISSYMSEDNILNIKLRKCFFKINDAVIFENLAVALYQAPSSKLTIALNENTFHLSLRLMNQLIDMFSQPNVTKFNPYDVICNFDVVIPKIEVVIHAQRKDKLGPRLFVIPIIDTRIHSHNHQLKYSTTFSAECILSPLQSLQIISQTIYSGKSNISEELIESKMSVKLPIDIFMSPRTLNSILNFKKDSEMAADFLFVNQTGMVVQFIVDGSDFIVLNNSGKLDQHFPNNPKIEINFPNISEKNSFDISILRRENAYPILVDSGYIMIQMTARSLILTSILTFRNLTSTKIILDVPEMGNIEIDEGDTFFLPPRFCQIRYVTLIVNGSGKPLYLLNTIQEINLSNRFFIVTYERDPISLVSTFSFNAPFYLQSFYPYKMKVKSKELTLSAHTNALCPIDNISPSSLSIDLEITSDDLFHTSKLKINKFADFEMLKTESKDDHPVYLSCQTVKKKGSTIFQLSAELFVHNQLGVQLGIAHEGSEFIKPKTNVIRPDLFSTFELKKSDINDNDSYGYFYNIIKNDEIEPFVFTSSPSEEFQVRFMILHSEKESTDKLYVNKVDSSSFITLPSSQVTSDVMPATVIMKHPRDHPNTTFMYIRPAFYLINKSDISLYVRLSETVDGLIQPNSFLPVRSIVPSFLIEFIMMNTEATINLLESNSFSLLLTADLSLTVETNVVDSVKYFTFTTVKNNRSFAVINDTDSAFNFIQKNEKEDEYIFDVYPYSARLFDLPDSRIPSIITIEKFGLSIDLDTPVETTAINSDLFYRVEMGCYGKYFLHLMSKPPTIEQKDYCQKITFKFDALYCHLVTHSSRELCQLTIVKTVAQFQQQKDDKRLSVSIGGIQLDDMNEKAVFPVVFAGFPLNDRPFISVYYQKFSKEVIGFIITEIQPITAKIDLSFIGDLIALFSSLDIDQSIQSTVKSIGPKHMLQLLRFMPITTDISFNGRTSRQASCFYPDFTFAYYLSLIPTIDALNIFFDTFEETFLSVTNDELLSFVGEHYLYSLRSQWLRIIGSAAFLGSPQKLLLNFKRSFTSLFKNGDGSNFMKGTFGVIIETPETCFRTVSSSCRSLTDDYSLANVEVTAMGSLKWGAKSFCHSLSRAVTGIVTRPIDKKREGVGGILKGVGEGIFGVVTNTVGGVLDLGSGVLGGVRRGLFGEYVFKRVKEPIKFEGDDQQLNGFDSEILYWDRNVQIYRTMVHSENGTLLISKIKIIDKKDQIVKLIEINDKVHVTLKFKDAEMASEFCDLIETQKARNKLIQLLDFFYPKKI
ncbi:hypothetical protein M9Y10_038652 [Tritrichomonas musculus]|uniref:Chorein N-terminal domain-containing protein n=1 Tax=Tritrichomonas musculus TaxID=1915356 RepID=A0ABR2KA07_9EUKA